jgi:hypothetical protein
MALAAREKEVGRGTAEGPGALLGAEAGDLLSSKDESTSTPLTGTIEGVVGEGREDILVGHSRTHTGGAVVLERKPEDIYGEKLKRRSGWIDDCKELQRAATITN